MMHVHQFNRSPTNEKRHPSGWRNSLKNMEPMSRLELLTYALRMRWAEEI